MAAAPKVDSRSVSVAVNEPSVSDIDIREVVVVAVGVDQGGAHSKERPGLTPQRAFAQTNELYE